MFKRELHITRAKATYRIGSTTLPPISMEFDVWGPSFWFGPFSFDPLSAFMLIGGRVVLPVTTIAGKP